MNVKCFVEPTPVPINYSMVGIYPKHTFDFEALSTITTLAARHLIVGEVTDVSFVFEQDLTGPISLVTVRVDKDIRAEIERVANQATYPLQKQPSKQARVTPPQTVSFFQLGGPLPNGSVLEAASVRRLTAGDYVFLRLMPSGYSVTHNGITVDSCTDEYGTIFSVEETAGDIDQHIIKQGWQGLDVNVMEMTRIVRATLKQPNDMRTLEREMNGLRRSMTKATRSQMVMAQVYSIETSLNLPDFKRQ